MNKIIENEFIKDLTKNFKRSPFQLNSLQLSDAEIIKPYLHSNSALAITVDSIVEEIEVGLYDDPYLIGWMAVMVNMSDLAAVGAKPLGILISEVIPKNFSRKSLTRMQKGISDACEKCCAFVLGGDTNKGRKLILTGCAIGTIDNNPNYRTGCSVGDLLYASDYLGSGNAFALTQLLKPNKTKSQYNPTARLEEGQALRGIATSCMDTSDGVISTLDQLMRLNHLGFEIDSHWESSINPEAKKIAKDYKTPNWFLWAGQHGEFELLFTIPELKEKELLKLAANMSWEPFKLGKVIEEEKISMPIYNKRFLIDSERVRNIAELTNNNVSRYLHSLLDLDREMRENL